MIIERSPGSASSPDAGDGSAPLRVLVVDDHEHVREIIRLLLEYHYDLKVVGEAGDGEEGVELAARLGPDVVLMDVEMPVMSGLEATRLIVGAAPGTKVVIMSAHDYPQIDRVARQVGATSFLSKASSSFRFGEAVRDAAGGRREEC